MSTKRGAARGVKLPNRRAHADALDRLPPEPTAAQLKDAAIEVSLADLEERVADVRDSWETDSLFEDTFEAIVEDSSASSSTYSHEANRLRRELRDQGPAVFCQRTVDAGRYTAKKLLSAFNIKPPAFLEGEPDESYYSLLSLAITRELSKRAKIARYNTVEDAVHLIAKSSNIILITGAGISTSLGIPDFRSKGTGLYSKLAHLGLNDPQEVFDIDVFKEDPSIFYSVAKDIIPATERYTPTHKFIAMLHQRGKLLTNYSQNIDNLEIKAGVPKDKLIQCHGSFGTASCVQCGYQCPGERIFPDIRAGIIPKCPRCNQAAIAAAAANRASSAKRRRTSERKRRRWSVDDDSSDEHSSAYDTPNTGGVMKPDITFFGEALPDEFSRRLTENDRDKVDLVIVIGTSLKVTPVSEIVSWLPPHIPQVYVSRQPVTHINFDIDLLGDCDVVVAELCRRLGWPFVHEMVPQDQVIDVRTESGFESQHMFEVRRVVTVDDSDDEDDGDKDRAKADEQEDKDARKPVTPSSV
ncbi:NAD-dependent histone deacetylase, silent information regulator Sir2 [Cordyceps fumosorosea ARSEF 2679]|uniref:NAD-dependent histone deacetylase, silent information regulator Sir2 n=1 Tax=Cordyceps fumosorosea (strain ARSEF 2679) TaxID=1081104 RepID=A0A167WJ40_CORFA|nr:NAD-dependent histone deacetylase, silent information regulator Sir2 [Cordyceps fumosorosea ARSEF 2679]OAA63855.1 NAD-dependent histone deacetylase, silent information regulator Sir2 [Cordyceps fumosorosea ARSEF 2679]